MRRINGEFLNDEQFKNAVVKDAFKSKLKCQVGSTNIKNIFAMNSIKLITNDISRNDHYNNANEYIKDSTNNNDLSNINEVNSTNCIDQND